jgi:hypothetical protein
MVSPVTATARPGPLRWAVWLLATEALAAGALAGRLVYQAVAGQPADLGAALSLAGFTALIGAALAGLAVALRRRQPRARAPAIVLQLLTVMLATVLITGGAPGLGIPLLLAGVAVATLLLAPSTDSALR